MSHKVSKIPALVCSEIGLVHCLGAAGISAIAGSENGKNTARLSRYVEKSVVFSSYQSEEFVQELCSLGETLEGKPVLMSYDDRVILNISRHREVLAKYYHILLPENSMVENLLDKLKFVELAGQYELPTPDSVKVCDKADLDIVINSLQKPYLIKPLYRHHWFHEDFVKTVGKYKKAFVCHSEEELTELYDRIARINPKVVVQEYVTGPDDHLYDINMYISENGEIRGDIVAQKMRVYPPTAGYGSYVITIKDEDLLNLSREIVRKLNLCGLINLQFKRDEKSGEPRLIEIHTRTSIFDVLGIKGEMNLPAIYYADMNGLPIPANGSCKEGVRYFNLIRDLQLFFKYRKNYGLTAGNMIKSYRGPMLIDSFSLKDPLPGVVEYWNVVRRLLFRS